MIINRVMWIAISIIFSHPRAVTDVLADRTFLIIVDMLSEVMIGVVYIMLSDLEISVVTTPLEFVVGVVYAGDVLTDMLAVLIIDVVNVIGVDILVDENVNGLADVMTPLEFTLPAP